MSATHYPSTRVAHVASVNARIGWKALTAAEYQDDGYAFLSTPNIKSETIDFEGVNYITKFRYDESPELKLRPGDVLLAKDGSTLGITNVVRELPRAATVNGSIAVLRPRAMEARFLMYALRGTPVQGAIQLVKDGMGVPHLFQADIKRLAIPEPPLDEQRRIADFLDDQVARIDAAVTARQRQRVLIVESVRSELDQRLRIAMDRYGRVPIRRVSDGIEQGSSPLASNTPANGDEVGVIKTSSIRDGVFVPQENKALNEPLADALYLAVGDVLVARGSGSTDLVGDAASVLDLGDAGALVLSDLTYRIKRPHVRAEFLTLGLISPYGRGQLRSLVRQGSGPAKARGEDILSIEIPAAPAHEQDALVTEATAARASAARAAAELDRSAVLLREYKQSLITAAVSGDFDIGSASGRAVT